MKKNKILIFILILIMPVFVLADAGMPLFRGYLVRVDDKNGVHPYEFFCENEDEEDEICYYKKSKRVIPYNTILQVNEEYLYDDVVIARVKVYHDEDEEDDEYYNEDEDFYINIKDVYMIKDEYTLEEYLDDENEDEEEDYEDEEENEVTEFIVFKEGAYIYKGQSINYDRLKDNDGNYVMLPVNYIFISKYYSDATGWAYVDYNGYSGWVFAYEYEIDELPIKSSVATLGKGSIILFEDNVLMSQMPKYDDKTDELIKQEDAINIPNKTKFDKYYYYDRNYVYVEYNDKYGWIDTNKNIARTCTSQYDCEYELTIEDVLVFDKYYDEIDIDEDGKYTYYDKNKDKHIKLNKSPIKSIYTLKSNTYIKPLYVELFGSNGSSWEYIDYKGKKGWILHSYIYNNIDSVYFYDEFTQYVLSGKINLYDYPNGKKTKTINLENEEIVDIDTYLDDDKDDEVIYWYYLDSDKYQGWISSSDSNIEEYVEEYIGKNDDSEIINEDENNQIEDEDEIIIVEKKKISQEELIYICIGGSIILILTSIVIIKLVNKKKNTQVVNNENSKDVNNNEKE